MSDDRSPAVRAIDEMIEAFASVAREIPMSQQARAREFSRSDALLRNARRAVIEAEQEAGNG